MATENEEIAEILDGIYQNMKSDDLAALCAFAPVAWEKLHNPLQKDMVRGLFISRAHELGPSAEDTIVRILNRLAAADREAERKEQRRQAQINAESYPAYLTMDRKGKPLMTVENYLMIMSYDKFYRPVKFNLLKNQAERHVEREDGTVSIVPWTSADEAESLSYIEQEYGFYSEAKHARALSMFFRDHEYQPVLDLVEAIAWDGVERISKFLATWMKVDDTAYSREISRLIFAGGINRLYDPGCKFDEVPVLIGTKQGEGKSTICRWLAIDDAYYTDITQFEGTQAIEQLEGAWICEIGELLALNRAKDQEGVKSFITRQKDKYRKPYEPNTSILPRRCIFIATTNSTAFLKDKTGNRRFYPIEVHSVGFDLYRSEKEIREYIRQCWAEAREKYKAGKMPAYADHSLLSEFQKAQADAMEDDWREGALLRHLAHKKVGEIVCCREIMREAFTAHGDNPRDPTKKESAEIGQMMEKVPGWVRYKDKRLCGIYGKQRGWKKVSAEADEDDELEF